MFVVKKYAVAIQNDQRRDVCLGSVVEPGICIGVVVRRYKVYLKTHQQPYYRGLLINPKWLEMAAGDVYFRIEEV